MKKKIVCVLLGAALCCGLLAGCGSNSSSQEGTQTQTQTTTTQQQDSKTDASSKDAKDSSAAAGSSDTSGSSQANTDSSASNSNASSGSDSTSNSTSNSGSNSSADSQAGDVDAETTGDASGEGMPAEGDADTETTGDATGEGMPQTEGGFSVGTKTDKEYESEWFGLRYTLPEDFIMQSEDEMEEAGMKSGDDTIIYDMVAVSSEDSSNIIIMEEKLPSVAEEMEEGDFTEVFLSMFNTLGADVKEKDLKEKKIAGVKMVCAEYEISSAKQTVYLKVADDHLGAIVITYADDEGKETILDGFSKL